MPGPTQSVVLTCGEKRVTAELVTSFGKGPLEVLSGRLIKQLAGALCNPTKVAKIPSMPHEPLPPLTPVR